jgi:hypothetical protein
MSVDLALSLMIALMNQSGAISALVRQAHAEGRELNAADWAVIMDRDDVAAANQSIALERAKAEGR